MTVLSLDPYEKLDAGLDQGELDSLTPDEVNAELMYSWTSAKTIEDIWDAWA